VVGRTRNKLHFKLFFIFLLHYYYFLNLTKFLPPISVLLSSSHHHRTASLYKFSTPAECIWRMIRKGCVCVWFAADATATHHQPTRLRVIVIRRIEANIFFWE